ncbi:orotate phosphoribosyltransferase [Candidatus Peregrinibacteria bacterium]|jgi:orotate phosphoribosyltransferase|nr:orotate phosphoribosyltransferase [Candidatus Peregrinibacteria bacterium]MBT4055878.1 orotate phosphoribosyltransferase [Candidatus Peregrinibacteria bacterium]
MESSEVSKKIATNLLERKAVMVKVDPPFSWVSGIKSPVYCDNRKMISFPVERKDVVDAFENLVHEKVKNGEMEMPDVIGGTATAAIPWAAFLAAQMDLPMIYIRPEKKEHGAGKQIEGYLESGQKVLIVEDLISTGGSSVKAAQAVVEANGIVTDIFAIVSWELAKATDRFAEAELKLTNLTGFTDLIGLARERGDITEEMYEVVMDFKNDTAGWGEKHGFA